MGRSFIVDPQGRPNDILERIREPDQLKNRTGIIRRRD